MAEGTGLENREAVKGARVRISPPALIGDSPSGKASFFDSDIQEFKSPIPSYMYNEDD